MGGGVGRHLLEPRARPPLALAAALRPPYPFGSELATQFLFALRLCWLPLLVSTVAVTFGAPGLQAANLLT
ncbi:MAG TPA: hypothetical protein VL687_07855, partial [Methylomirabilota bacterium]|nr:hypothetical protein [Methylomirabilota bacterium]